MEWSLDINDILKEDITKITNSLIPPGFEGDVHSIRRMQDSLSRVLDRLGELSAAEQGLSKVITTAAKLRTADNHIVYLIRDAEANNGRGAATGLLKVGRKHLFLLDPAGGVRELEPLCVLDFYVVGDCQRRGLGRRLFDHMLQDQKTTAHRLAVDGPSAKMEAFLAKNYHVPRLLRQTNNFAVSPRFFDELASDVSVAGAAAGAGGAASSGACAASGGARRYSAPKPQSSMASVIHGAPGGGARAFHYDGEASAAPATPSPAAAPAPPAAGEARRPQWLAVTPVPAPSPAPALPAAPTPTPAGAPSRRDSALTDKGFFDVKFYHKKLW